MALSKAKKYLENVLVYKEAIPFTKYTGGIGRHAVGKQYKAPGDKVGWPQKATKTFLDLLTNVESNAEVIFYFRTIYFVFIFLIMHRPRI